mgnify:CR=1 FL=1
MSFNSPVERFLRTFFHCAVEYTAMTTHRIRQTRSINKKVVLSEYSNKLSTCMLVYTRLTIADTEEWLSITIKIISHSPKRTGESANKLDSRRTNWREFTVNWRADGELESQGITSLKRWCCHNRDQIRITCTCYL